VIAASWCHQIAARSTSSLDLSLCDVTDTKN
jgi:hypothetical protein